MPAQFRDRWIVHFTHIDNLATADPDRQRRRMAEFLVHGQVPVGLIDQIAAYDAERASLARTILAGSTLAGRVFVRPAWYYGFQRKEV